MIFQSWTFFQKNKEFLKRPFFFRIFYSKWRKLAFKKKSEKIFPFWLTYLHWLQEGIGFIFSILWGKWIGYGQQDDLAKFGYEKKRKFFGNPQGIFTTFQAIVEKLLNIELFFALKFI
jgi:hypothetical protein